MKRSRLLRLPAAFIIVALTACAPRPATHISLAADAPTTETAVQADELKERADPAKSDEATRQERKLTPAEAMKLMLVQLLVAR
jgi:hypothetical protein